MKHTNLHAVWVKEDIKKIWLKNFGRKDHVGELGVHRILLNQIKKLLIETNWTTLTQERSHEHADKASDCITGKFTTSLMIIMNYYNGPAQLLSKLNSHYTTMIARTHLWSLGCNLQHSASWPHSIEALLHHIHHLTNTGFWPDKWTNGRQWFVFHLHLFQSNDIFLSLKETNSIITNTSGCSKQCL